MVSFVATFGYLLFFRLCHQYGFKQPTGQSNAVQLLVTLRVYKYMNANFQIEYFELYIFYLTDIKFFNCSTKVTYSQFLNL